MSLEEEDEGFEHTLLVVRERENSVEPVLDSSRYFVLKIEDGHGKHAFIGLGFAERNEAFDFNVALSDHEKYVRREHDKESGHADAAEESQIDIHPAVNHRLKEGETIRINVKHKASSGTGMLSAAGLTAGHSGTPKPKALSLAPPPSGAGKIRSPLPPPPNDPVAARIASTARSSGDHKGTYEGVRHSTDSLSDLSQLQKNLPSTATSGSTTASGWAAF
ncbi:PH-like domain superfamily [Sesbania bispinosa]|nr:PH-like domain superfamily [Sesbania bispinosa]